MGIKFKTKKNKNIFEIKSKQEANKKNYIGKSMIVLL